MTNRQIESARRAMTRYVRRGGQIWIRIFPDHSYTKKPAETRMGSGKGSPEGWVAVVKPGRVLFEMSGVTEEIAKEAMRLAAHKLPIHTSFLVKRGAGCGGDRVVTKQANRLAELRAMDAEELEAHMRAQRRRLFEVRFQQATGQVEDHQQIGELRKEIARR